MFISTYRANRSGFTLIELLIVISIIGILSTVVLASLGSARERARDSNRVTDIRQIQLALELYFEQNGEYPTDIATLATSNFIQAEPLDPLSGSSYFYAYNPSSNPVDYHVAALLENENVTGLTRDADLDSAALSFTNGFDGASDDCASGSGTELCFDARP